MKKAKFGCEPLYREGDKFRVVKKNKDPNLMPIEALHLRTKQVYGFEEDELE